MAKPERVGTPLAEGKRIEAARLRLAKASEKAPPDFAGVPPNVKAQMEYLKAMVDALTIRVAKLEGNAVPEARRTVQSGR